MKKNSKLWALLLASTLVASVFAGCGKKPSENPGTDKPEDKTLVIGVEAAFEEKWNPFYAESAYDQQVMDQIFVNPQQRDAKNVLQDWAGNISYEEKSDGSVVYTIKIKDNMKFTDGEPITIDDLIFYFKVVCDPSYTGPITFTNNDIPGVMEYYYDDPNYQETVDKIAAEVKAKYSNDTISKEDYIKFLVESNLDGWWDGNPAGKVSADKTWSDYIIGEGFEEQLKKIDATKADEMLKLLAEVEYTNYADQYKPATWWKHKLEQEVIKGNLKDGAKVTDISGIVKVDEYTCTITFNSVNVYGDREINAFLAPEHYYGKNYKKGDTSSIEAIMEPLGSGPYIWKGYSDGIVTAEANENYFEGVPKTKTVKWQYVPQNDIIPSLAQGTIDIGVPSGNKDNVAALKEQGVKYHLTDNAGYGYLAINTKNVPLAVRKGVMSLMNRQPAVTGYYGELATVIERPMTTVLAEYPTNAKVVYEYGPDKALEYFKAAGYTQKDGKLVDASGKQLVLNVYVGGEGIGAHPAYPMLAQAAEDMKSLGGELQVQDVQFNVLQAAMNDGSADMFCLAWGNSTTADKSSIYKTGGGQNRTGVSDSALDDLLAKIPLTMDLKERSQLVSDMLDKVMELAVELPLYQRKNIIAYNEKNINMDTVPEASTFYNYTQALWKVEMK